MAARTGIAGSFGIKAETTWGTFVTVDEFLPIISETLTRTEEHTISRAIRSGRTVLASEQWNGGIIEVGGPVELELSNKNVRTLFKAMFGIETGASPYTYTPVDNTQSLTLQVGRPGIAGTVHPFTYTGAKVASWEISAEVGETVSLTVEFIAAAEHTSYALASPSYTASMLPYKFTGATLTIAGSAVNTVRSMSLSGDNMLARRNFLGSQTTAEPFATDLYEYTGEVVTDFESLTAYSRFVTGTEAALVMTFTRAASTIVITTNVKFNGATPTIEGREVLAQSLPFMCVGSTTDASAITVVYTP